MMASLYGYRPTISKTQLPSTSLSLNRKKESSTAASTTSGTQCHTPTRNKECSNGTTHGPFPSPLFHKTQVCTLYCCTRLIKHGSLSMEQVQHPNSHLQPSSHGSHSEVHLLSIEDQQQPQPQELSQP